MKNIFYLIIFSLASYSSFGEECHIDLYKKIYLLSSVPTFKDISQKSSCPDAINRKLNSLISSSKGKLSQGMIDRLIQNKDDLKIRIRPTSIQVYSLSDIIHDEAVKKEDWKVTDPKIISGKTAIGINENSVLNVYCNNCSFPGEKNIQLNIKDVLSGKIRREWVSSKILVQAHALVAIDNQGVSQQAVPNRKFIKKDILSSKPENFFTNHEHLKYYRLNRKISSGEPLTYNHLSPLSLVKGNQIAKVVLVHKGLKIMTTARPTRSAAYGELVELRSTKGNKRIIGKVIDQNKVMVNL